MSYFPKLGVKGLKELWVYYGPQGKARYLACHSIAAALGERKCAALRGFHAFSGCDTVSFFNGKRKRSAFSAWLASPDVVTDAFIELGKATPVLNSSVMSALERFTVLLYRPKSTSWSVDSERQLMFVSENKSLFAIPPTAAALHQHALRAAYQAGVVWGRCQKACEVPGPTNWGWVQDGVEWQPLWTTLGDIWESCRSLDICGCGTPCNTLRCSCRAAGLDCILACKICKASCTNTRYNNTI